MITSINPREGLETVRIEATAPEAVAEAVARCRVAQQAWAARPLREREAALERVRVRFLESAEELVALLSEENGRPEAESWLSEIIPDGDLFKYWIGHARRFLRRERVRLSPINYPGKKAFIEYVPRGVLALITPWNLPVAIPLRTLVPALLAGNGVVFKPSEYAPRVSAHLHALFAAELPEGLVTLVQGGGEVGAALVFAGVDMVVFTGSVASGRKVAAGAAQAMIPAALELGGKDAAIVLADADLERTAQGLVWGAMFNAGQNCAAVERVYVEAPLAEALTARIKALVEGLRLGDDVGPMTTPFQLETVVRQVEAAKAAGARVLAGGGRGEGPGLWFQPTVVVLESDDAELLREETFGPVLPIRVVRDAEEALTLANASPFGLTASVWTRDLARGEALARRIEAGVVMVNNHGFSGGLPQLPWSGRKESGGGVTSSHLALREMVRPRAVLVDRSKAARELWWYPYNARLLEIARALRDLALGRLAALPRLLRALPKRFK